MGWELITLLLAIWEQFVNVLEISPLSQIRRLSEQKSGFNGQLTLCVSLTVLVYPVFQDARRMHPIQHRCLPAR